MNFKQPAALLFLTLPLLSHAVLKDYSQIESDCQQANPDINNSVVMGCAEQASDAAKKDMNVLYQKIYKIMEARDLPEVTSQFEVAQKSWLALRENWCDVQGFMIGTPMYSVCRMNMNISRVNELNQLLEQVQD